MIMNQSLHLRMRKMQHGKCGERIKTARAMKYKVTYIDEKGDEYQAWVEASSKGNAIRLTHQKYANVLKVLRVRRTMMIR